MQYLDLYSAKKNLLLKKKNADPNADVKVTSLLSGRQFYSSNFFIFFFFLINISCYNFTVSNGLQGLSTWV